MNNLFHGYCYLCYGYGHDANQCRPRVHSAKLGQKCYKCSQPGHYANTCRYVALEKLENKNKVTESNESKKKTIMVWRKKETSTKDTSVVLDLGTFPTDI